MTDLIRLENNGVLYALVVKSTYKATGVRFVTEPHHTQQLAYMSHKKGVTISPHIHNPVQRVISTTQEVLLIRNGKLRCDLYDDDQVYLQSCILDAGDLIILLTGGHGFEALDDVEMIEVKQGPYAGDKDKLRFDPVKLSSNNNICQ